MAYQATIIPVMIASPGDVSTEREIVREVIHDWNDVNAAFTKVMLSPVGWDSHSSPELGARPQELINNRVLEQCDLLVGVFWTRLGTPTGESESGTVEEIREHIQAGKPAMVYFSSTPVALETVDIDQYQAVQRFKSECESLGLVEKFQHADEFRAKFSKHLPLTLSNNPYLKDIISKESSTLPTLDSKISSENRRIALSGEARNLLKAAAQDKGGSILKLSYLGGKHIQAGSEQFGDESARESAKWEDALNELVTESLVVPRGYKDQVFELTHEGWLLTDEL